MKHPRFLENWPITIIFPRATSLYLLSNRPHEVNKMRPWHNLYQTMTLLGFFLRIFNRQGQFEQRKIVRHWTQLIHINLHKDSKNGLNQEMGLMKINITLYSDIWYSICFNFDYLQLKRKLLLYNLFSYSNTVYMHLRIIKD